MEATTPTPFAGIPEEHSLLIDETIPSLLLPILSKHFESASLKPSFSSSSLPPSSPPPSPSTLTPFQLSRYIDHTLLNPHSLAPAFEKLSAEASDNTFYSVCVNSSRIKLCKKFLKAKGSVTPKLCSVIAFPLGSGATAGKVGDCQAAIAEGAEEIDMVINVGELKDLQLLISSASDACTVAVDDLVLSLFNDVASVAKCCDAASDSRPDPILLKVILEAGALSKEELILASSICKYVRLHLNAGKVQTFTVGAGPHFIKTSTGFGGHGGATIPDVAYMRKVADVVAADGTATRLMGVKASGGVRDRAGAVAVITAGADRIGASAGLKIVQGGEDKGSGY